MNQVRHRLGSLMLMLPAVLAPGGLAWADPATQPAEENLLQRRCQLAYVLLWKRDFDAASAEFRKVLAGDPAHDEARLGLALALERKGDLDAAEVEFGRIPPGRPQHAAASAGRARILAARRRFKEAVMLYEDLKARGGLGDEFLLNYVETLAWDGQFEKAMAELAPLRNREKMAAEVAKAEGQILAWSGRAAEAVPRLRQALEKTPEDDDLRIDLARALWLSHQQEQAEETLRGLTPPGAGSVRAVLLRTDMLASARQYEPAIALVTAALDKHPADRDLRLRMAELLSWTQKYDQAVEIYRELLRAAPDDRRLHAKIGETLSWAGRFEEAADHLRRALGDDKE